MIRVSKVLFTAATSLALTGVAFANGQPVDPAADPATDPAAAGASGDAGASAGATVGADVGTEGTSVGVSATAYTAATWPMADIDRPLNAAKSMLELKPDLTMERETVSLGGMDETETGFTLGVAGRYGLTDKIEGLFEFDRIVLSPTPKNAMGEDANGDRIKGVLAIGAGMTVMQGAAGGKLDVEPKAALFYDLLGETAVVAAGADVRYKLSNKMWIGTPINRPGLVLTVKGLDDGMGGSVAPMFLNIPVGFGFQATPALMIQANTNLIRWNINKDAQALAAREVESMDLKTLTLIGADIFDLDVTGIFALSHTLDVRVNLDFGELRRAAGDSIALTGGVNFRM